MPYYLVTQTSLVEANDALAAAKQTLAKLEDAQEVTFTVKLDENHITPVTVRRKELSIYPDAQPIVANDVALPGENGCAEQMGAPAPSRAIDVALQRSVIGFALFLSALWSGWLATS